MKLQSLFKKAGTTSPSAGGNVINTPIAMSSRMQEAIRLWSAMYEGNSPWIHEPVSGGDVVRITSLGLPAMIASEKARMVTLEMESEITAPMADIEKPNPNYEPPSVDEFGNVNLGRGTQTIKETVPTGPTERADFMNHEYKKLQKQIRRQLEYGIAKGGFVIKPYPILHEGFTAAPEVSPDADKYAQMGQEGDQKDTKNAQMGAKNAQNEDKMPENEKKSQKSGENDQFGENKEEKKPFGSEENQKEEENGAEKSQNESQNEPKSDEEPKKEEGDQNKEDKSSNNDFGNQKKEESVQSNGKVTNTSQETPSDTTSLGTMDSNQGNGDIAKKYNAEFGFDFVQADAFLPLAFDASGKITEAAFIQPKVDKDTVYFRIEHHKLENNVITVTNMAFKSQGSYSYTSAFDLFSTDIGNEVPLTEVPEWSALQPQTQIENVDRLLFAYFRMPDANTIDPLSPLGVSGYSRAVSLIKDADIQYSTLLWEYEGGTLAIDVDRYALMDTERMQDGTVRPTTYKLPTLQQRLFRKVDLNQEDTYEPFAPNLRDQNYITGLNTILTKIEDVVGLSRGTLSEQSVVEAKTATELKILKQRSYAANKDLQLALQDTLEDVVYIMDVYSTLYHITPEGQYEVSYEWDDSILNDSETELANRMTLLNAGLMSKLELRMWYFGETEHQAQQALQKIDDEGKQKMENNIMAQARLGEQAQGKDLSGENPDDMNAEESDEEKQQNQDKFGSGNNMYNNMAKAQSDKSDNSKKKPPFAK